MVLIRSGVELVPVRHKHTIRDLTGAFYFAESLSEVGLIGLVLTTIFVSSRPLAIGLFATILGFGIGWEGWKLSEKVRLRKTSGPRQSAPTQNCTGTPERLKCYGEPAELQEIADLEPRFFEPLLIQNDRIGSILNLNLMSLMGFVKGAAVLFASVLVFYYVWNSAFGLFLALAFAKWGVDWLAAHLNPVYYRISPGRLEILRYRLARSLPISRKSISLSTSRILCRYDRRVLEINHLTRSDEEDSDQQYAAYSIDLSTLSRPHSLVTAVFRAAMCEDVAPPLPGGELL